MNNKYNILIVAGEPSGDLQASLLVRRFHSINENVHFWGFGGNQMREAGVETIVDVSELAVMGLLDVVKHIPRLRGLMNKLLDEIERRAPCGVITVDYPGFNLSLIRKISQKGIPVGYYISPQIWAWAENRVEKIRKYVNTMVCILPFEKKFYARHGIDVEYVGHPFVDIVKPEVDENEFYKRTGIENRDFLLLLPGSRRKEVLRILPIMLKAYSILHGRYSQMGAVIAAAEGMREMIKPIIASKFDIPIIENFTYSAMSYAKAGIVASGSATLEALISKMPTVVVYRVDAISWIIGKRLIKTPHIALANLVAERRLFPELIQHAKPEILAGETEKILFDDELQANMRIQMEDVSARLGSGGAAEKAAKIFSKLFF